MSNAGRNDDVAAGVVEFKLSPSLKLYIDFSPYSYLYSVIFIVVALKCETSGDESRSAWIPFRLSMYVVRYIYICIRIRRGKHILSNVGEGIRQRVYPRGILSKTICGMVQGKSRATSAHVAALYVLSNGTRALHRIVCP